MPRTASVACVDPCRQATALVDTYAAKIVVEEQDALTKPASTSNKAAAVLGSYAAKIATGNQGAPTRPTSSSLKATSVVGSYSDKISRRNDKAKVRLAPPSATFRKKAPGGTGGETWSLRACRRLQ